MIMVAKVDGRIIVGELRKVQGTDSVGFVGYGKRMGYIQRVMKHN